MFRIDGDGYGDGFGDGCGCDDDKRGCSDYGDGDIFGNGSGAGYGAGYGSIFRGNNESPLVDDN